ncbi:MAG: MFS transporter [Alphaproteobacteria bacterium]
MTGTTDRVGTPTRLAYGFGAVAYGVKDNGFSYFLLLFFNQVMGLPAYKVTLAILIALCVDAISDPIVGNWSDRTHSRWGRRHPFMYAAALPIAAAYFFLWNPPEGLSDDALFLYLLGIAILVRTSITFYEVPGTSMVAELTGDYHVRTSLLSYRYLFGWLGGLGIAAVAYKFLLVPTEQFGHGLLNLEGYNTYGVIAALLMLTGILVSALGTHHRIPQMKKPPPKRPINVWRTFGEIFETLANKSFLMLFLAAIFFALAAGLSHALSNYFAVYFWGLEAAQLLWFLAVYAGSAVFAFILAPFFTRRMGKKHAAIAVSFFAVILAPMPIFLRLIDFFPPNDSLFLLPLLLLFAFVDVALIITSNIIVASMIADVVEDSELKTGRRSEGLFFAARTFVYKIASGMGIFSAGIILSQIKFPDKASPGAVDPETITNLGIVYVPTLLGLYLISVAFLSTYTITEGQHEENLRALNSRRNGEE